MNDANELGVRLCLLIAIKSGYLISKLAIVFAIRASQSRTSAAKTPCAPPVPLYLSRFAD